MSLDKATSTVIDSIYASQIYPSGARNNYILKYSASAQSWVPSDIIVVTSLSSEALSGTYFGDGSNLKNIIAAGGFATDVTKLPLAGGVLTGHLSGTSAGFITITGTHYGDGSNLTGVIATGGSATDATKLPLVGGTLTGPLFGTNANFNTITGTHYGDGSNLTGVIASGGSATDSTKLPLAGGTLTGAVTGPTANFTAISGTHYGDGSNLTGVIASGGSATDSTKLPLAGGTLSGHLRGTTATFSETISAPSVKGQFFYGDGRYLTGISFEDPSPLPSGSAGQVLTFDGGTGTWVASALPGTSPGGTIATNILMGTGSTTYPLTRYTNQLATNYMAFVGGVAQRPGIDFNIQGSNIVFGAPVATGIEIIVYSLINVTALSGINLLPPGTNGQVLTYNGSTNTWVASAGLIAGTDYVVPATLSNYATNARVDGLSSFVDRKFIPKPAVASNGQSLVYNSAGDVWVAGTVAAGSNVPVGGGTDKVFWENDININSNYTITAGKNAGTFGPVNIASGATVTIPNGSTWSII